MDVSSAFVSVSKLPGFTLFKSVDPFRDFQGRTWLPMRSSFLFFRVILLKKDTLAPEKAVLSQSGHSDRQHLAVEVT